MIKHGVQDTGDEEKQDAQYCEEYKKMLVMPENTRDEIYKKYSVLAVENPDDFFFWNILKLFVAVYEETEFKVLPKEYQKYLDIIKKEGVLFEKHIKTQDDLTFYGIQNNCKSYAVWNHRRYIYAYVNKESDMKLCKMFFEFDPRSFHCWNYVKSMGYEIPVDVENYSSLEFRDDLKVSRLIMIDPNDEGHWLLLKRKIFLREEFYVKVKSHCIEFIFNSVFKGTIKINGNEYTANDITKFFRIEEKVEDVEMFNVEINNVLFKLEAFVMPRVVQEILKLEPNNFYANRFYAYFKNKTNKFYLIKQAK